MTPRFSVALLPQHADPKLVRGADVVMTDVLRASSTMATAIYNGVRSIHPVPEIEAGIALRDSLGKSAILGGERQGVIIPGYDLGNSPLEFNAGRIGGKQLIMCTTNGTVALESCRGARRIVIGAFVNLQAVASAFRDSEQVVVVCAGTHRRITTEDVLFAGALGDRLGFTTSADNIDDSARIAITLWQSAAGRFRCGQPLSDWFKQSAGGRNLMNLNCDQDVEYCSQIDLLDTLPILDETSWTIAAERPGTSGATSGNAR